MMDTSGDEENQTQQSAVVAANIEKTHNEEESFEEAPEFNEVDTEEEHEFRSVNRGGYR